MAVVTGDNWIRYTYTLTDKPETKYATIKITKIEIRDVDAPSAGTWSMAAGSFTFYYKDSSGGTASTSISHSSFPLYPTWKTVWTGTKTINSYKTTSTYHVLCSYGGCYINYSALTSYTVAYNANGGVDAPTSQKKYYSKLLALSYGKPTRTGYTFVNWKSNESTPVSYLPGGSYTANSAVTMSAQWSANRYRIVYYNNGGDGSINDQIKIYDDPAYFDSGITLNKKEIINGITKEYELLRWNINPDDSGTSYALGSEIPNVANNLAVYAIWEPKYLYPKLSGLQDYRTATNDITDIVRADSGEYIYITFNFIGCSNDNGISYNVPSCTIYIDDDVYNPILSFDSGTNTGTLNFKPNVQYNKDTPHNIIIELVDPNYTTSSYRAYDYITTSIYPIDLYSNDQVFSEVVDPDPEINPSVQKWYELANNEYVLTSDTVVINGKTYYQKENDEVYMGIMHPYTKGIPLSLTDTYVDGDLDVKLDVDANASSTTDAIDGEDKDLFNDIRHHGWYSKVVDDTKAHIKHLFECVISWVGDWMASPLIRLPSNTSSSTPSSTISNGIAIIDNNDVEVGYLNSFHYTSGTVSTELSASREILGQTYAAYIAANVGSHGEPSYTVSNPSEFRKALEIDKIFRYHTYSCTLGTALPAGGARKISGDDIGYTPVPGYSIFAVRSFYGGSGWLSISQVRGGSGTAQFCYVHNLNKSEAIGATGTIVIGVTFIRSDFLIPI